MTPNNKLKDLIRLENSDFENIRVVKIDDVLYTHESTIHEFMEMNDISYVDSVINKLSESYCKKVNIIGKDEILCEYLNPKDAIDASDPHLFEDFINKAAAYITKQNYDEAEVLRRRIKKCEDVLEDIKSEKAKVKDKSKQNDSYKFTTTYILNITKVIIVSFIIPIICGTLLKPLEIPKFLSEFLGPARTKVLATTGFTSVQLDKVMKIGYVGISNVPVVGNIYNMVLSIKDYEKLLNVYENKINTVKQFYEKRLRAIG